MFQSVGILIDVASAKSIVNRSGGASLATAVVETQPRLSFREGQCRKVNCPDVVPMEGGRQGLLLAGFDSIFLTGAKTTKTGRGQSKPFLSR
jgi:hypothetical protein